uniref:Aspartate beta-hydroxylase n=1 Tax=Microcebus murinus TaxID=30608 RepID=A0A8C5Y165_MICMU
MAPRKNAKGGGGNSSSSGSGSGSTSAGSSPGARRETKHGGHKNGKKGGLSGSSFFTWFMVIALLGVWTSVAVVWFDLVDYEEVLAKAKDFRYNLSEVLQGKLGIYDADGDGDFDVDDAKVLLEGPGGVAKRKAKAKGFKERSASEPTVAPEEVEPYADPEEAPVRAVEGEDLQQQEGEPAGEPQPEDNDFHTVTAVDDQFETLEPETFHDDSSEPVVDDERLHHDAETVDSYHVEEPVSQDYNQDMEEIMYEQENPDSSEPVVDDERLHHDADGVTYQDYDEQVYEPSENEPLENEPSENEVIEISEVNVPPVEEHQEIPPDT